MDKLHIRLNTQKPELKVPLLTLIFTLLLTTACQQKLPEEVLTAYQALPEKIDYNLDVKPILSDRCFACHGNDKNKLKAGLRLDNEQDAYKELAESPGKYAINPGKLNSSQLFHRIISEDPELVMPPQEANLPLSSKEKAILIKWIEQGAVYKPHWAFQKPRKYPVPSINTNNWAQNPIDHFVLAQLAHKGLQPSKEADKRTLLRRLSLDLTGLPPSIAEIEHFMHNTSSNAYESEVDRLLNSIHYGEKMATDWMDVARFSDTYGYQVDRYRDMSPWRDWVIKSFNENRPYDEFIIWQLAGDLMPDAKREQVLATAFNRLHPLNMEDGIIDEEFRVESVADRVAVLGDGLLGLTLSCAKCHDHKYDPISQKEYYELYSFFNNINETGQISWDEGTPVPNLQLTTPEEEERIRKLREIVYADSMMLQEVSRAEMSAIKTWISRHSYASIAPTYPSKDLIAHFSFEQSSLRNQKNPSQQAKIEREFSKKEEPNFVDGYQGRGLQMDGDAWLDLQGIGVFKREDPFSIGLWVNIPSTLNEGVIFHKNKGTQLHSYRGFHLYLVDNKLQWMMAHTYPENAIIELSVDEIPKEEWIHLMVTYDGSSTAHGTKLYVNGQEIETIVEKDHLYKDIIFHELVDIIYPKPIEPNIKVGARWRGRGLTDAAIDDILIYGRTLAPLEVLQIASPEEFKSILSLRPEQLKAGEKTLLEEYYLTNRSKRYEQTLNSLKESRHTYVETVETVQELMVMEEMDHPRKTYILNRGVYDDYGEEVFPATPSSIMKMPEELPKNRLGLALWLTHPDHPLTARVAVNRYWQQYFGRGLVASSQDFGNQGSLPDHPELLDWLATQFISSKWDIKALQKLIVMSATYRQQSLASDSLRAMDKENVWLARGPSLRLSSEMLRDNALAASGLLNKEVGGESVYPYQPEGLWSMNFDPYPQDHGDKLYRRSLYTMWRRTNPNPTLSTFDQPERNVCTVKRQKTTTPLQALVLLNDPTFVESSRVLAQKMSKTGSPKEGIIMAYTLLTGKIPSTEELALLIELQSKEFQLFQNDPNKLKGWLSTGEHPLDNTLSPSLVAANAVVASVILNGDVTITKR